MIPLLIWLVKLRPLSYIFCSFEKCFITKRCSCQWDSLLCSLFKNPDLWSGRACAQGLSDPVLYASQPAIQLAYWTWISSISALCPVQTDLLQGMPSLSVIKTGIVMLLLLSVIWMAVAMVMTKDSNTGFKISASKPKISGSALISQFQTDRSTLKRRGKKRGIYLVWSLQVPYQVSPAMFKRRVCKGQPIRRKLVIEVCTTCFRQDKIKSFIKAQHKIGKVYSELWIVQSYPHQTYSIINEHNRSTGVGRIMVI